MKNRKITYERLTAEVKLLQAQRNELVELFLESKKLGGGDREAIALVIENDVVASCIDESGGSRTHNLNPAEPLEDEQGTNKGNDPRITDSPLHLRLIRAAKSSGILDS